MTPETREAIVAALKAGTPAGTLATTHGVTVRTICRVRTAAGLPVVRGCGAPLPADERAAIVALLTAGGTDAGIAHDRGHAIPTVKKIRESLGLPAKPRTRYPRVKNLSLDALTIADR